MKEEIKAIAQAVGASIPKDAIVFLVIGVGWVVGIGGYIWLSKHKPYGNWDQRFNLKEEAMRDRYLMKDISDRVSKRAL